MSKKDDVRDLLTKINAEGWDYYFNGYTCPDSAEKDARRRGVSKKNARMLYQAGIKVVEAEQAVEDAMRAIADEFDIDLDECEY